MKKVALGLLVLIVVLIGAALVAPGFIDWTAQKGRIEAQVRALTGHDVRIEGDVNLTLLPAPTFSATRLVVANVEGADASAMAELDALKVRVALWPLLRGEVQVERIELIRPTLRFEVLADGRRNWERGAGAPGAGAVAVAPAVPTGMPPADRPEAAAIPAGIRLDSLRVVDGTLVYRDVRARIEERITGLDAEFSAASLRGPFAAAGTAEVRDLKVAFEVDLGRLDASGPVPVTVALRLSERAASLHFAGAVTGADADVGVRGRLKVAGENLAGLLAAVTGAPGVSGPLSLARPFALEAQLDAAAAGLDLSDLMIELGATRFTGTARVAAGTPPDVRLVLSASRLDLDSWLAAPPDGSGAGTPPAARTDAPGTGPDTGGDTGGASDQAGDRLAPDWLTAVTGTLEVSVDAMVYRGQVVRQAKIALALTDGRMEVTRAAALLPGGSDISLVGSVVPDAATDPGGWRFDGHLEAASDNLRAILEWLGLDVSAVPAERLRRASLSLRLAATPQQLTLGDIDVTVDLSRISGGIVVALRERPGLGVGLAVDRLNLDAYLPRAPAAHPGTAPGEAAGSSPTAAATTLEAAKTAFVAPAVFDAFDANFDIRLGSVTAAGVSARAVRLDATLQDATLSVRELRFGDVAGASLRLNGAVAALTEAPVVDLAFDLSVPDIRSLARALDWQSRALFALGAVTAAGTFQGRPEALSVDLGVDVLGGRVSGRGTLRPLAVPPAFELTVTGEHRDLAALVAPLAPGWRLGPGLGAVSLTAAVTGTPQRIAVRDIDAALGPLGLGGTLTVVPGGAGPLVAEIDLALALTHPDAAALIRALVPGAGFAGAVGAVDLKARATGDSRGLQLVDLAGSLGENKVSGTLGLDLSEARPMVNVDLTTGALPLQAFFAPAAGGGGKEAAPAAGSNRDADAQSPAAPPGVARWSREPLDLSALQNFDADLKLRAAALIFD
ncbi:MAG: AsmA family protein, partial [Alphaproteobacteria bacterium]